MKEITISGFIQDTEPKLKGGYYTDKNTGKIYRLLTSDVEGSYTRNISHLTTEDFAEVYKGFTETREPSIIQDEMTFMDMALGIPIKDRHIFNELMNHYYGAEPTNRVFKREDIERMCSKENTGLLVDSTLDYKLGGGLSPTVLGRVISNFMDYEHISYEEARDMALSPMMLLQYNHIHIANVGLCEGAPVERVSRLIKMGYKEDKAIRIAKDDDLYQYIIDDYHSSQPIEVPRYYSSESIDIPKILHGDVDTLVPIGMGRAIPGAIFEETISPFLNEIKRKLCARGVDSEGRYVIAGVDIANAPEQSEAFIVQDVKLANGRIIGVVNRCKDTKPKPVALTIKGVAGEDVKIERHKDNIFKVVSLKGKGR